MLDVMEVKDINNINNDDYPIADIQLTRRLEQVEGNASVQYVEAKAKLKPDSQACWLQIADAFAIYDSDSSPLTQSFGLGTSETVREETLQKLESFFFDRGCDVNLEISPVSASQITNDSNLSNPDYTASQQTESPQLLPMLQSRGYFPIELSSVMYRPIRKELQLTGKATKTDVSVRKMLSSEVELWAKISVDGWAFDNNFVEFIYDFTVISASRNDTHCFFAEINREPVATGSLWLHKGVALLAGASTLPKFRRQGAQLALLEARLNYAVSQGCDLAMMSALPGSSSQKNAERQGFRIAYTRIKWQKKKP
jgi:hypothetical protein